MLVSVTRLRLRSWRFLPGFGLRIWGTQRQVVAAAGFRGGALLPDRKLTFWTMTAWDDLSALRTYMAGGAHGAAMPRLQAWCDEASVVHWDAAVLPDWVEAEARMRRDGRASRVRFPSPAHATLAFAAPRTSRSAPLAPRAR